MKKQLDILVVENDAWHKNAAKALLEGHNLTIANTFEEAVNCLEGCRDYANNQKIEPKHFDVMLTDLFFRPGNTACSKQWDDAALGWPVALIAAQHGVKYIAMVTDVNHHQDPVVSAFDFFKEKKNWKWENCYVGERREPYRIDNSLFVAYDSRDLPKVFALKDRTFTEKRPLATFPSDENYQKNKKANEEAGYMQYSYDESGYQTAKNWKAALELILKCGEKKD